LDIATDIVGPSATTGERTRHLGAAELAHALRDSRARTLRLFDAYHHALGPTLAVPQRPDLNPPLWELGHIGWFADWWLARNPQRLLGTDANPDAPRHTARQARRGLDADALYNSSTVPHGQRWALPLPSVAQTLDDLEAQLNESLALLDHTPNTDTGLYFHRLALFHEDMHAEAAVYMAQTLGFDPGCANTSAALTSPSPAPQPLAIAATTVTLGIGNTGFAFDNECGAHTCDVSAFSIDSHALRWAEVLPCIEAGAMPVPRHLRHSAQGWQLQRWGHWQTLDPHTTACHLSAHDAQAWCRWAGRRLPTEAEWLAASAHHGFVWGTVWEWTSSPFAPFPGFAPHPYRDYSAPWFDGRPVLKGASAATHPRLHHRQYRNYFTPERNDILAGLRSVAA
jgi:iron(II)-dependent oxidoreductase